MGFVILSRLLRVLTGVVLIFLFGIALPVSAGQDSYVFNMVSNVEHRGKSLSVECFQRMGIELGFFQVRLPVGVDEAGQPYWADQELKDKISVLYEKFEDSGIKIFPIVGVWNMSMDFDGAERQFSVWGRKSRYRCFAEDSGKVEKSIAFLVEELSRFKAFGGICVDDEPSVMAGGSYTPAMIEGFKRKYDIAPPSIDDFYDTPRGLVPDEHPVLLWLGYQHERMAEYYQRMYRVIQDAVPGCPVYFVPSVSWVCSKTISVPDTPPEKIRRALLGTLDDLCVREFRLYTQFFLTRLTDDGWDNEIASGLCQAQFVPPNSPRNVVPIYAPAGDDSGGISVDAFRRYVLQAFAEGARGIAYWPISVFAPGHVDAAADIYKEYIEPLCSKMPMLKKMPGRAAVLFSKSTAAFADIWRNNPIERFEHIHRCDALAYYLLKRGVPFDIILEDELGDSALSGYSIIVSSGVTHLTKENAGKLEDYIKSGGRVIFDADSSVDFKGLERVPFDATAWFNALKGQYHRESDLRYQCGLLEAVLGPLLPAGLAPCRASSMQVTLNYMTDGDALYVFVVNDDLFGPVKTVLSFDQEYSVTDLISWQTSGVTCNMEVTVPKGGMLVLRLDRVD